VATYTTENWFTVVTLPPEQSPKREPVQRPHRQSVDRASYSTIPIDSLIKSTQPSNTHDTMSITATSALARYFLFSQWKNVVFSTYTVLVLFEILLILTSSSVFLYAFKEPTLFGINYFFLIFICACLGMGVYARIIGNTIMTAASLIMTFIFFFLLLCDKYLQQLDLFDFVRDYFWIHSSYLVIIIKKQSNYLWQLVGEKRKKDDSTLTPVHVYIHNQNTPSRRRSSSAEQKPV
jgi:hypothetical protein